MTGQLYYRVREVTRVGAWVRLEEGKAEYSGKAEDHGGAAEAISEVRGVNADTAYAAQLRGRNQGGQL